MLRQGGLQDADLYRYSTRAQVLQVLAELGQIQLGAMEIAAAGGAEGWSSAERATPPR